MRLNRLAIVGLAVTVVGALLAVGFWPLASMSGAELLAARNGNRYPGFATGARITVHEKVLDVTFSSFLGASFTTLEIDDGDSSQSTTILVRGDVRGVVGAGQVIYAYAVLQNVTFIGSSFEYWEVPTPADIHASWPVDTVFYSIMIVGVVVLAFAAFRGPDAARPPQG